MLVGFVDREKSDKNDPSREESKIRMTMYTGESLIFVVVQYSWNSWVPITTNKHPQLIKHSGVIFLKFF